MLNKLEKYNIKACIPFFIKVDHFFLKEPYGSTHIVLDSNFSNDAQNSIYVNIRQKSEFAKKILENKTQKYHGMKTDETLRNDDMETFSFVSLLQYSYRRERSKGCYGSKEDNTVHSVQKVNLVLYNNTDWKK